MHLSAQFAGALSRNPERRSLEAHNQRGNRLQLLRTTLYGCSRDGRVVDGEEYPRLLFSRGSRKMQGGIPGLESHAVGGHTRDAAGQRYFFRDLVPGRSRSTRVWVHLAYMI